MRINNFLLLALLIFPVWSSAAGKDVKLATTNWPPYYTSEIEKGGFVTEITRKAFEKMGYTYKVNFIPWKRALLEAKNGKNYQGILGIYYTDERSKQYTYSKSLYAVENGFFIRNDQNISYKQLNELKEYKIGILRGSSMGKKFEEARPLLKIKEFNNIDQGIKLLLIKRIDLMVDAKAVTMYLLNTKFQDSKNNIKYISPPISSEKLYVGFSKKIDAQIITDFNKGIDMIHADGTYEQILQSFGMMD
jgi:polar amino acid transport system substrate-binding protein